MTTSSQKIKKQTHGHKKNPTHFIIFVATSPWTGLNSRRRLYSWVDKILQVGVGFSSPEIQVVPCLSACTNWLTDSSKIPNLRVWPFLAPTARISVINPFLSVTEPGTKFSSSGRWLLHYTRIRISALFAHLDISKSILQCFTSGRTLPYCL